MYCQRDKRESPLSNSKAFARSGWGYLSSFLVLGLLALLLNKSVGVNFTNAALPFFLFIGGGLMGLAILAIYNKVGSL